MGVRLVGAALNAHWATRLNPTERLVLITMCLTAKDTGTPESPASLYFAGHDNLMITLTGDDPRPGTPQYEAARKQVQRAIRSLISVGAVTLIDKAGRNKNARYQVHPESYGAPANVSELYPARALQVL